MHLLFAFIALICTIQSTRLYTGSSYPIISQQQPYLKDQQYSQYSRKQSHDQTSPNQDYDTSDSRKLKQMEELSQGVGGGHPGANQDISNSLNRNKQHKKRRLLQSVLNKQNTNYIRNYDFSLPVLNSKFQIYKSMPEWETNEVEKGIGNIYNRAWGQTEVIELDGNQNNFIRQRINLRKGKYIIEIKYAARVGYVFSSLMSISWNGKTVKQIGSTNQSIQVENIEVEAVDGENVIEIRGQGKSDSFGMTVAYVKLTTSSQVTPSNEQNIRQERKILTMKKGSYRILFDWQSKNMNGEIQVIFNTITIAVLKPYSNKTMKQIVYAEACEGNNLLIFKIAGDNSVNMSSIEIKQ